ncbi:MAG: response regulator [Candidatus Bathyarchaeia archaeon]|nr:response regulator [Candidatus Bathyarchaeota archaeon]
MKRKSILLVDDDIGLVSTFRMILDGAGYHVDVAATGREALKRFEDSVFDLIILDVMLPDLRGDEVLRCLRRLHRGIKALLITGYSTLQDSIDALGLGVSEILLKPISPEELLRAVREALS